MTRCALRNNLILLNNMRNKTFIRCLLLRKSQIEDDTNNNSKTYVAKAEGGVTDYSTANKTSITAAMQRFLFFVKST